MAACIVNLGIIWSASCPGCLTPVERTPSTYWIGGWMGPRTCLDTVTKRKPSLPLFGIELQLSSP